VSKKKIRNTDFLICVELDNEWGVKDLLKIPSKNVITNKYDRISISNKLRLKYSIANKLNSR